MGDRWFDQTKIQTGVGLALLPDTLRPDWIVLERPQVFQIGVVVPVQEQLGTELAAAQFEDPANPPPSTGRYQDGDVSEVRIRSARW